MVQAKSFTGLKEKTFPKSSTIDTLADGKAEVQVSIP